MGRKPVDEIGKRYGRLTVLRMATEDEHPRGAGKPIRWLCQCDCGNTTFADGRDLRNGRRISCGCQSREKAVELARQLGIKNRVNLTGMRFGRLVVLQRSDREEDNEKSYYVWKCKCDCGSITYTRSNYLLSGHTTSCGCGRHNYDNEGSKGEKYIASILNKNNIIFEREKSFKDLHGGIYRYDFFLPNLNILIEYNGSQHYEFNKFFYKSRSDFLKAQERDRRKISYCLAHNIALYCIPYWEIDSLTSFKDITNSKFRATSKFHNDEVWRHQKSKEKSK